MVIDHTAAVFSESVATLLLSDPVLYWMRNWWAILFVVLSAVCVAFYNGRKGRNDHRLFYWAYPAHLFLLWGILLIRN